MIHRFNPKIYPRLLWVQIGKEIPEGFSDVAEFKDSCDAQVDCCHDDKANRGGVLIRFENLEAANVSNITHESIHAAIEILSYCDIKLDADNSEVLCYLAGWIAGCCGEVVSNERKEIEK
jgi:hypothetical protein